jgi:membrane-associated phospholipid phosphatase
MKKKTLLAVCRAGFRQDTWWSRLLVAAIYLPSLLFYFLTNTMAGNKERAVILKFALDDKMPVLPAFVIPYVLWFGFVAAVFLYLVFDRGQGRRVYRHTGAVVLATILASVIFFIYPTYVPRPDLAPDSWTSRLLLLIYAVDEPYNCFPSLHVAVAAINSISLWHYGPRHFVFRLATILLAVLIMFSTVLTSQHYWPDVLGGLVLAVLCSWLAWRLLPDRRLGLDKAVSW